MTEHEPTTNEKSNKVEITPELIAELKKRFPEEFYGTPEWEHKVRVEAIMQTFEEDENV